MAYHQNDKRHNHKIDQISKIDFEDKAIKIQKWEKDHWKEVDVMQFERFYIFNFQHFYIPFLKSVC